MRRPVPFAVILAWALAGGCVPAEEITGNHRLFERFIEDGATLRQGWMEARAGYANWDGGHDLGIGTLLAFRVTGRLEAGGSFGYIDRDRARGEGLFGESLSGPVHENGLSDLDLYAKLQLTQGPRETSVGLVVKLPVADETERLGTGQTDYELFMACRGTRPRVAWVGNGGVRLTGDSRTPGGAEGRPSLLLGGGALVRLSYSWTFLSEAVFETKRFSEGDPELKVVPALDFRPTENISLRLGVAIGLTKGSPDQETTLAAVFQF